MISLSRVAPIRAESRPILDADRQLLASARARAAQGVRDAREGLAAQAQLLQQRDAATQLDAQAVSTELSLIKALGGGYEAPDHTDKNPTSPVTAGAADHERH